MRKRKKTLTLASPAAPPFSVASAARLWGMSEGTLRRRIKSGLIEVVCVSSPRRGVLRIEAATVHALLAARWCPKTCAEKEVPSR